MSRTAAWMPLYIGDYLADTGHLTAQQHGAYLLMLMHQWRTGPLPNDDRQLAAIARVDLHTWKQKIAAPVRAFFCVTGGGLTQKRLTAEKLKSDASLSKKSQAGSRGADSKWGSSSGVSSPRSHRLSEARQKGTHTTEQWIVMVDHHENRCARCDSEVEGQPTKDHIMPIYQGGSDDIENLQPLCRQCNSSKGPDTTDHRKPGWREKMPGKMPGRTSENASGMPVPSQSPSPIEKKDSGSLRSPAVQDEFASIIPAIGPLPARDELWGPGLATLQAMTGLPGKRCRALLGKLTKTAHDNCAIVLDVLKEAAEVRPVGDPVAWITAAVQRRGGGESDVRTFERMLGIGE